MWLTASPILLNMWPGWKTWASCSDLSSEPLVTWSNHRCSMSWTRLRWGRCSTYWSLDWCWRGCQSLPEMRWMVQWSDEHHIYDLPTAEVLLPSVTWWGTWAFSHSLSALRRSWADWWWVETLEPFESHPLSWGHSGWPEPDRCCWGPHACAERPRGSELTWQLELPLHQPGADVEVDAATDAATLEMRVATEADNEVESWCKACKWADDSTEFEMAVRQDDWDEDGLSDVKLRTMKTHIANRILNRMKVHKYWYRCDEYDWFLLWTWRLLWSVIVLMIVLAWLTFTYTTMICFAFMTIPLTNW